MSTTVENDSGKRADGDFCAQKGPLAVFDDASHQRIAFEATFKRIHSIVS